MSTIIKKRLENALEISHKLDKYTQPDTNPFNKYNDDKFFSNLLMKMLCCKNHFATEHLGTLFLWTRLICFIITNIIFFFFFSLQNDDIIERRNETRHAQYNTKFCFVLDPYLLQMKQTIT